MRVSTLKDFFIDSIKSLKRKFPITIYSIISIAATIFIVGMFYLYISLINNNSNIIFKINIEMVKPFKWFGGIVLIIIQPLSLFLILNSFKISIFTRRSQIRIMQLIGASDWFIRWPLIIEGIIIGIVGAIIGSIALFYAYSFIYRKVLAFESRIILVQPILIIKIMLWRFGVIGAFIGPLGNIIVLRKFLNRENLEC